MKIWSRILCTIIVLVSLVPCADAISYKQGSITPVYSEASIPQNHNEKTKDACSPFCICSCCNTTFIRKAIFSLNIPTPINMEYPINKPGKTTPITISVWQPPRLG
ncbi:MAG: DUF6660 family protein [Daejeonella sp.]